MQILHMLLCNYLVDIFIPTTTMHDVVVELHIGEAQIILVCLTAKTVRRSLVYQLTGNGEFVANTMMFASGLKSPALSPNFVEYPT